MQNCPLPCVWSFRHSKSPLSVNRYNQLYAKLTVSNIYRLRMTTKNEPLVEISERADMVIQKINQIPLTVSAVYFL